MSKRIVHHCYQCGGEVGWRRWSKGHRRCTECGIAIGVQHNLEMKQRVGKAWEEWKAATIRAIEGAESITEGDSNGSEGNRAERH